MVVLTRLLSSSDGYRMSDRDKIGTHVNDDEQVSERNLERKATYLALTA
jgi:hypothetical protein